MPGAAEAGIAVLPGVTEVEVRASRVAISTGDSDTTLRALLATYPHAHDIEVTAVGLDVAFLTLTSSEVHQ